MEIVRGLSLDGGTFSIDGKRLVDCTLTDCTIEYGGGAVILERTMLRNCRYVFTGPAKMTVEFLECLGLMPRHWAAGSLEDCLVH